MTRYSVFLALLFCNPLSAAYADDASAAKARAKGKPKKIIEQKAEQKALTIEQFIQWLLNNGKDRIDFNNRAAPPLNLPSGGVPTKSWGVRTPNHGRMSSLIIKESFEGEAAKPNCLIFLTSKDYPKLLKTKSYYFRFRLDGSLERAFSNLRKNNNKTRKSVRASGVITIQDIDDPEIQEKAQAELDFWLKRAARLIAKKKAEPKKQASSSVPAARAGSKDSGP